MSVHETAANIYNRWQKGLLHATLAVNSERHSNKADKYHQKVSQSDIDVCLKCNKKKCNGSEACFAREKRKKP